ncbi:UNVERIFIED_CONTAM: hypothetical protein FKN15_073047 [Acipenser sinensis]
MEKSLEHHNCKRGVSTAASHPPWTHAQVQSSERKNDAVICARSLPMPSGAGMTASQALERSFGIILFRFGVFDEKALRNAACRFLQQNKCHRLLGSINDFFDAVLQCHHQRVELLMPVTFKTKYKKTMEEKALRNAACRFLQQNKCHRLLGSINDFFDAVLQCHHQRVELLMPVTFKTKYKKTMEVKAL